MAKMHQWPTQAASASPTNDMQKAKCMHSTCHQMITSAWPKATIDHRGLNSLVYDADIPGN